MSSKNKQSKLRQTRNDEIEEESYLNYTTKIKYVFCSLSVYFLSDNFAKIFAFIF